MAENLTGSAPDALAPLPESQGEIQTQILLPTAETEGSFGWGAYFQAVGLLFILLFLFWLSLRLIRRFGGAMFLPRRQRLKKEDLSLEAQLPLGRNRQLCVVNYLGKRLLLGVTEQQITLLDSDTREEEAQAAEFRRLMEGTEAEAVPPEQKEKS